MGIHERPGATDEWYTPKYIFDALDCQFDLDVASPPRPTHVPCKAFYYCRGLEAAWHGFVWMNPPFGGRNGLVPWLEKFMRHGHGIALVPDRTSAPWFQKYAAMADGILFINGKVKFERPDGTVGAQPANGTALLARGELAAFALAQSQLGLYVEVR